MGAETVAVYEPTGERSVGDGVDTLVPAENGSGAADVDDGTGGMVGAAGILVLVLEPVRFTLPGLALTERPQPANAEPVNTMDATTTNEYPRPTTPS
jgi:hypothetical protein